MTAVVEMSKLPMDDHDEYVAKPEGNGNNKVEVNDGGGDFPKKGEDTLCASEIDGGTTAAKEVKIDIETVSFSGKDVSQTSPKSPNGNPAMEEFSEEKDAPEVTTRVYDFNMVKRKTLPRISFGSNGLFRACSSHSKSYILVWTLMPVSLVICIVILILYFTQGV